MSALTIAIVWCAASVITALIIARAIPASSDDLPHQRSERRGEDQGRGGDSVHSCSNRSIRDRNHV